MTRFGIIEDYDYNQTHKRHRMSIWSGSFASVREGEAFSLPNNDGYMVTLEHGGKVRVECPAPRTDENYIEVDAAINAALNDYFTKQRLEYLRDQIDMECISTGELIELQGMAEFIDPGDVQLLEWAGVPEFEEEPEDAATAFRANSKPLLKRRRR